MIKYQMIPHCGMSLCNKSQEPSFGLLEVEVKQCGKVNPRREVVTGLYLTEALNLKKALEGSK